MKFQESVPHCLMATFCSLDTKHRVTEADPSFKTLVPDLPMYRFGLLLAKLLAVWLWWGSIPGVLCNSSPLTPFSYWACHLVVITYLPQRKL